LSIIGAAVVLTACGGGGDDAPAAASTAEGFWRGAASTGSLVTVAVLETGETWGVFSFNGSIAGVLYGNTTSGGNTLSGSGSQLIFGTPPRLSAASYTGSYAPKATISVSLSDRTSFSGSYQASYDAPASLANLAGSFSGTGLSLSSSQTPVVTISTTGAVSVAPTFGCSGSGTARPRPSGKNVFDVAVTFTGGTCTLAAASGVAYYDTTTRELIVLALNNSKTDGFIYVGRK